MGKATTDKKLFVIGPKLVRLPNLSSLACSSGTKVTNLEPLKELTALQTLDLGCTQVANLEPLKGLTALRELNLNGAQVASNR